MWLENSQQRVCWNKLAQIWSCWTTDRFFFSCVYCSILHVSVHWNILLGSHVDHGLPVAYPFWHSSCIIAPYGIICNFVRFWTFFFSPHFLPIWSHDCILFLHLVIWQAALSKATCNWAEQMRVKSPARGSKSDNMMIPNLLISSQEP